MTTTPHGGAIMSNAAERRNKQDTAKSTRATDDLRLDDIVELPKYVERYPDQTNEARLRWFIFNRERNGIEKAGAVVKRLGRWYVVVPRMRDWLLRGDAG
jgi:hypothetical protein